MSGTARILLIDDDAAARTALRRALEKHGYEVESHASGVPAVGRVEAGEVYDLVITDLRMPEMDGIEVLRRVRAADADVPVILITAFGTIENAVEAMRLGARDYLTKPLDLFDVRTKVEKALQASRLTQENRELSDENRRLRRQADTVKGLSAIVGSSPAMADVRRRLLQVAPTASSVLITGESGTGKELVARAVHDESPRRLRPFLPINCAAIPRDILESELFGHERGAFTGAVGRKPGKFELANGGTLFLDEIGELPADMQAKLLRVLEDRSFMRVGGVDTVRVDVRIVAATNAELEKRVAEGRFRTDLYYRLKVVALDIPPLRARPEDIPLLAAHFLERLGEEYARPGLKLSERATESLKRHRWPGNVRELRNLLESLVVLGEGPTLDLDALPAEYRGETGRAQERAPEEAPADGDGDPGADVERIVLPRPYEPGIPMAELEKRHILSTLAEQGRNRTRAADVLGIGLRTLQRKLKEYKDQGEDIPPAASE
jgi:DNA-binding NtrC family response regulator